MYRTLLLFTALVMLVPVGAQAVTPAEVVNQITVSSIQNYLTSLPTYLGDNRCINFTLSGNVWQHGEDHDPARDQIFQMFRRSGWTTFYDPFNITDTSGNIWIGANVVAIKQGTVTPDRIYLIMGHYDSTANHETSWTTAPGADDNASGVSGLLEMARVFSRYTFDSTIIFVASDGEETTAYGNDGITYRRVGSMHYVTKYASQLPSIQGMISLDMISWADGTNRGRLETGYSQNDALNTAMKNCLSTYGGLGYYQNNSTNYSDHVSFGDRGVPALMLIESSWSSNPNYHRQTDACNTPNYINYTYNTNMVKAVAGYLCENAGLNGVAAGYAAAAQPDSPTAQVSPLGDTGAFLKGLVR